MDTNSTHPKKNLRAKMRSERRKLNTAEQAHAAIQVRRQLQNLIQYRRARRAAFYLPSDGELDPRPLMHHALEAGKACYLPVLKPLNQKKLHFVRYHPGTALQKNRYGIEEPPLLSPNIAKPRTLDVIFMPLVAFDRRGHRLGMGGGYYDRTLSTISRGSKPLLIGLSHGFQEVERLPSAPWDVPLDYIATENELITTNC